MCCLKIKFSLRNISDSNRGQVLISDLILGVSPTSKSLNHNIWFQLAIGQLKHTVIRIGFFHERRQQQRAMWENSEALCTTASRPEQGRTRTGRLRDGMAVAAEDAAPSIPLNGSFPRSLPKQIKIRRAFIRHKKGTAASLLVSFALEQNSTRLKHCIMWGHFHMMSAQGEAPSRWSEGGIIHTSIKYKPIGKGNAWIAELNVVIYPFRLQRSYVNATWQSKLRALTCVDP